MKTKRISKTGLAIVCAAGLTFINGCEFAPDADTLTIVSCLPAKGERGVAETASVHVTFNRSVEKNTVEEQFSLRTLSGSVSGEFSWLSGKEFFFTPDAPLRPAIRHAIEIPRSVRDSRGNPMTMDYLSDFYTGKDTDSPRVLSFDPPHIPGGATDVPLTRQSISIIFSEKMNIQKTESAFSLSPHLYGYFLWNADRTILEYRFTAPLEYGTRYTLTIAGTAEDDAGNPLGDASRLIFFTVDDHTIPGVLGIHDAATISPPWWSVDTINTGISRGAAISVDFTKPMDRFSCEAAFELTPSVNGTFSWNAALTGMVFTPARPLDGETVYEITFSASAKDANGRRLAAPYGLLFKTDAPDSLGLIVGTVWGSHDGGATDPFGDNMLFNLAPPWPVMIETGPVAVPAAPNGREKDYYFMIRFLRTDGALAANFDCYSLFDAIEIDGQSIVTPSPFIKDIYPGPSAGLVIVAVGDIDNSFSVITPAVYRITLAGGDAGVRDVNGNTMKQDFRFDFQDSQ